MASATDLLTPLRRYWGFDSFRPLQELVVRSLMAGHDSCVVMPTGGGKSLCYQLPALVSEKTAGGVSPIVSSVEGQGGAPAPNGNSAAVAENFSPRPEKALGTAEGEKG